jgi:uncharacterized membrane protein YphA (DoxX/SURF4 family)
LTGEKKQTILRYLIAAVWFISGLFCKVLNFVPRHERIVAKILGNGYAAPLTRLIGIGEILMGVWVLTRFKPKQNAVIQMLLIAIMNILEFLLAPDLLLWGRLNIVFAFMFTGLIYYYEFILNKKLSARTLNIWNP